MQTSRVQGIWGTLRCAYAPGRLCQEIVQGSGSNRHHLAYWLPQCATLRHTATQPHSPTPVNNVHATSSAPWDHVFHVLLALRVLRTLHHPPDESPFLSSTLCLNIIWWITRGKKKINFGSGRFSYQ